MSETTTETTTQTTTESPEADTSSETPETAPEVDSHEETAETDEAEETGKGGNAEAARYRRQLRETETERDTLRGTVERLQHAEVTRLLEGQLSEPADLFEVGKVALADLLGEDGKVDQGLVATAVFGLLESRPGLRAQGQPQRGPTVFGHSAPTGAGSGTWQDVLRG